MSVIVVQDEVELLLGKGGVRLSQETQELLVAVARETFSLHLAGGHIEGRE